MCSSKKGLALLTNPLSRNGGGVFDSVRNLAMSIGDGPRYSPSVMGGGDDNTQRDLMGWGNVRVESFNVRGPKTFGYTPGLARALGVLNPDLLHAHGLWTYSSLASARWSRGTKPYLVSPHGMLDKWALDNSRWKKRPIAGLYENTHLHGAACLHALNKAEADSIRAYGLGNPICVIPNGVELPAVPKESREPCETSILLYLGRLHPKKGLLNLVEAWSKVRKEVADSRWRLVIAGWDQDGHSSQIQALSARLGVSSSIDLVGPQFGAAKDVTFESASAFVLPSLSEGLPIVVLEAWSWGLPALMTPECNLPEGEASGAAIMMEHTVESIVAALRCLFSMPHADRADMGARGRLLVGERFQWRVIGRQMEAVYDWVLGSGPKPDFVLN